MNGRQALIRRRPLASVLLLMALVMVVFAWQNRVALQAFPTIISAYTAKEYCSCRYVVGNPADFCAGYVKQWLPSTLIDDPAQKRVTSTGLGRSSSAVWKGLHQGCQLLP
ncbi:MULTISPECIES: amidase [unclassified Pseudomonas]|uniref:amidase n=1 Tax=unclassified Pseudomonas TaxID=196821 RepID=UPI002AC936CF|nr:MULTISPECIES: amidase [unclassified Pseudomonas]MEB0039003.1 amidase [Pseudomonas sp. MH10]MEB0120049.1 amidase [Pseudomonas sp. CCI1.2]WPX63449.1 amidase [Pseudomonas sp. MH10]